VGSSGVEYLREAGRKLFAGGLGGLLCGLIVGGVGGRLAMFLLRLTSGPEVIGVTSDDGFTIGLFTGSTVFLLGGTAITGAMLGVVYLMLRRYLPDRFRALLTVAVVGGALIIKPGGVDFTRLEPRWLAVASFVLLPGLFGFALSKVVDRLLKHRTRYGLPWLALAGAAFVLILIGTEGGGSLALVVTVLLAVLLGWIASTKVPTLRKLPSSAPVVWIARTAMLAGGLFAASDLAKDIAEIF
jgi:hypothetical protein